MGAIFGAGASIASTAMTNETNWRIAQATNKTNEKLAREQNEWNEHMYDKNNEYNTPLAQARRLQDAGLSDAAVAQSVGNVPAQAMQSADLANQQIGAPMQAPDLSALQGVDVIGIARQLASLKKENAEADISESESKYREGLLLTKQKADEWLMHNLRQKFIEASESWPYRREAITYEGTKASLINKYYQLRNDKEDADIKLAKQQFSFLENKHKSDLEKLAEEISYIKEQTKTEQAQQQKIVAETGEVEQYTQNLKSSNTATLLENQKKRIENILLQNGNPESWVGKMAALLAGNNYSTKHEIFGLLSGLQNAVKGLGNYTHQISDSDYQIINYLLDSAGDALDWLSDKALESIKSVFE